jgi:hypothetical protein
MRNRRLGIELFLACVSVAAVVHSSWSLNTYFTGPEPQVAGSIEAIMAWVVWVVPGFLIAFAIDVGLLTLARQIRDGHGHWWKLAAFFVLCALMGYSQFLYIMAHLPSIPVGAGVRTDWLVSLTEVRDLVVVIYPFALPVTLILYAFSDIKAEAKPRTDSTPVTDSSIVPVSMQKHPATCQDCGRLLGEYDTPLGAEMALRAHRKHCAGIRISTPEEVDQEVEVIEQ